MRGKAIPTQVPTKRLDIWLLLEKNINPDNNPDKVSGFTICRKRVKASSAIPSAAEMLCDK